MSDHATGFPTYDPASELHGQLVVAASDAEDVAAGVELPQMSFQAQRRRIREALTDSGVAKQLGELVAQLLAD